MKSTVRVHRAIATFSFFSSFFLTNGLQAQQVNWLGGTGNYGDATKWDTGTVPVPPQDANVSNGGTALILPGHTFSADEVFAGNANQDGTIIQSGGTLNVQNWLVVARDGGGGNSTGVYTLSGGTVNKSGNGNTIIGESPGNIGTLNVSGIAAYNSTGGEFWVGQGGGGTGIFNQSGGSVSTSNWTVIGRAGGNGTYNLSDGTITKTGGGNFIVADNSTGTMQMTGGAVNVQDGELWVGSGGAALGVFGQSAGTVSVNNNIVIGRADGDGTYNLSGTGAITKTGGGNFIVADGNGTVGVMQMTDGTLSVQGGEIWVGQGGGSNGVMNQSGGAVTVNNWVAIGRNGGTGTYNLSGGTLTKTGAAGNHFIVGASGNGTMIHSAGLLDVQLGGLHIGENAGSGTYTFSGGTINATSLKVGWQGGSVGNTLTMSGAATVMNIGAVADSQIGGLGATTTGAFNLNSGTANFTGNLQVGAQGNGTLNQTGGVLNSNGGFPVVGRFAGGVGNLNISGGAFNQNANRLIIGEQGTGTATVSGTGVLNSNTGGITIGLAAGGNGALNVQAGGSVNINGDLAVANGGATGALNVTGGTFTKAGGGNTVIGNGGTAFMTLSSGAVNLQTGELQVGQTGSASATQTGGSLSVNNWFVVGRSGGTGVYNLDGGTITKTGGGNALLGSLSGNGTMNQTGGTFDVQSGELLLGENANGVGTYNFSGGIANAPSLKVGWQNSAATSTLAMSDTAQLNIGAANDSQIGSGGGTVGVFNLNGGTANFAGNLQIGANGNGTLNQTGGTLNTTGGFPVIGRFGGGTGTANISGGIFNVGANFLIVGEQGPGTLNVSSTGQVASPNGISIGHTATGTGTVNLNGGVIQTSRVFENAGGPGTSTFNFNGGTLRATQSNAAFMEGLDTVSVQAGGAVIDSNGFDITVAQSLVAGAGNGGLTKQGMGTLNLANFSNFTGGTVVNAGTLQLSAGGSSGTVTGELTVNPGASLVLAATDSLGFSGNAAERVTLVRVNGGTVDNVVNAGNTNQGFRTNFVLNGGALNSTGGGDYNFTNGFGISSTASNATSVVSSDINLRDGNVMPVNVLTGTTPSGNDLTFSGVVYDNGSGGGINKTGSGRLQLTGVNTYTGPTTVNGGSLIVSGAGSIASSSSVTVAAGTLGGTGRVGDILLRNGGTVAPGESPGTLFGDSLVWDGGGLMAFELGTPNPLPNDGLSDRLVLNSVAGSSGAFTNGGGIPHQFDFLGSTPSGTGFNPGVYTLVDFLSTNFAVTDFSYTNLNGFGTFQLTSNGGGAGSLLFVAIPEPGRAALLGMAALLMLGRRRRK